MVTILKFWLLFRRANMSKEIYTEIFRFYHVQNMNDTTKRAMRKMIKNRLKNRKWENLSDIEKNEFKLVTMRSYLLNYTPERYKSEVEKNIETELKTLLFQANAALKAHNKDVAMLYKQFFDKNATEDENYNSYMELCANIPKYAPTASIPSFEEWKEHPLTLYDYKQSEISYGFQNDNSKYITPEKIDHYIVKCLQKIIEDELNININVNSIRQCLENTQDIDLIENEFLHSEIDKTSPLSEEFQKQLKQNNLNIMDSYRKLTTLDFISKRKTNSKQGE